MNKRLISRVIMLPDCSVHIASYDKHTMVCSPQNLTELLEDPIGFVVEKQFNPDYTDSTAIVNPNPKSDLEDIQGLTLLKLFSNGEVVCHFPKLFETLFARVKSGSKEPLNLIEYVNTERFSDEKHFFLKFFSEFTNNKTQNVELEHSYGTDTELNKEMLNEILNTSFMKISRKDISLEVSTNDTCSEHSSPLAMLSASPQSISSTPKSPTRTKNNETEILTLENTVSVKEFAQMHDVDPGTVSRWCKNGDLRGTLKHKGDYRINPKSPRPVLKKSGNKTYKYEERGLQPYLKKYGGNSYQALQDYIVDKEVFSPELAEYIRNFDELQFYVQNHYYEVNWKGRPCLIIDIKPSYFSNRHQKTNREIILEGEHSPVVPNEPGNTEPETDVFVIHHVGQKVHSPFAIVKDSLHTLHNSKFHYPASQDWYPDKEEDLHGSNFESLKKEFWIKYLEEFDTYKTFRAIPKKRVTTNNEAK